LGKAGSNHATGGEFPRGIAGKSGGPPRLRPRNGHGFVLPAFVSLALHGAALAACLVWDGAAQPPAALAAIPITLVTAAPEEALANSPAPASPPSATTSIASASAASDDAEVKTPTQPSQPPKPRRAKADRAPPIPERKPLVAIAEKQPEPSPTLPEPAPAENSATPKTAAPAASALPAALPEPSSSIDPAYLAQIMASLARHKRYPDIARQRQEQGSVVIAFAIDRAGHVVAIDIRHGSGNAVLDSAAEAMVRDSDPLPPLPTSYASARLDMTFPIAFTLQ
jgi:protein TonB